MKNDTEGETFAIEILRSINDSKRKLIIANIIEGIAIVLLIVGLITK